MARNLEQEAVWSSGAIFERIVDNHMLIEGFQ